MYIIYKGIKVSQYKAPLPCNFNPSICPNTAVSLSTVYLLPIEVVVTVGQFKAVETLVVIINWPPGGESQR